MDAVVCDKCHGKAEFSHVEVRKGYKFEVYYCEEGHENKVQVSAETRETRK